MPGPANFDDPPHIDPAEQAAVAFLTDFIADRQRDAVQPLSVYLARYSRFEQRIAEEWLRLNGAGSGVEAGDTGESDSQFEAGGLPAAYRILRELGRGGQGVVYLAHDRRLDREVALKVLDAGGSAFLGTRSLRFEREARAIARLDHPCLCAIYDVGGDDRQCWIAMKFVDGPSLEQRLAAARASGSGPPSDRLRLEADALLIEQLAHGLHQAHVAGLVHRDIKPANILIGPHDVPVLVDFGIARAQDGEQQPMTLPGSVVGTASYLAPELLRDRPADARSDLWSLGACLYEMLTLQRPYSGATPEAELRARATDAVPDVRRLNPAVPRDLAIVTATALAPDPAHRYASVEAFAADLQRVREHQPIAARPAGWWLVLRRWSQRKPALAASLAALFVVMAVALVVTVRLLQDTRAALADVTRLSDQKLCTELQVDANRLWPLREERIGGADGMDAWLGAADALLARRGLHEAALDRLAAAADGAAPWQRELLTKLLRDLDELTDQRQRVAANREFASTVRQRTIVDAAAAWQQTASAIGRSDRYGGLQLSPQLGLVPLGPDPQSGMFEFAVLQSGAVPVRDPATGRLVRAPESAIVLVLLPGGSVTLGAERSGSGNVDPEASDAEGPCYVVSLAPFFIGKHELTQGQWQRHTRANPSNYRKDSTLVPTPTDDNPVEQVTWTEVDQVLRQLGLQLPTESQWEYAYRGGTTSPFPGGADSATLQGRENVADADARAANEATDWAFDDTLRDGYLVHAPVGTFLANGFGCHDMGGNVREWCLDSWEDYVEAEPRPGDGYRTGRFGKYRVIRGASFAAAPTHARSAYRSGMPFGVSASEVGVRVARVVDP